MLPSLSLTRTGRCVFAFAIFVASSSFAHPVFFPVESTPYDRQMHRVDAALSAGSAGYQVPMSLDVVNQWMTELRAMPYRFSPYWQTPSEVSLLQVADCKGKAVALYAQMRRYGAKNLCVVIGKRHPYDTNTHAWVEWHTTQGTYTLDPTFNERAALTAELDPLMYVASYAYDGDRKYRASRAGYFASTARVATGSSDHVYTPTATTTAQSGLTNFGAPQFYPPTTAYRTVNMQQLPATTVRTTSWSQPQNSTVYVSRPATVAKVACNSRGTKPVSHTGYSSDQSSSTQFTRQTSPVTPTRLVSTKPQVTAMPTLKRSPVQVTLIQKQYGTAAVQHRHVRHLAQHHKHRVHSKALASRS